MSEPSKLSYDATKIARAFNYQYYIALEKCFELRENEKLYIETYGDVTVSSGDNGTQIEVKNYEKNLTDLDANVWNTLKNWINDPNIENYKNLILLTTQELGSSTLFQNWNSYLKNEKIEVLEKINEKYQSQTEKSVKTKDLLQIVLNKENRDKLLVILEKFTISSSNIQDDELYKKLSETRTHGVIKGKRDDYINALMGFIISPKMSLTRWEICYESFHGKTKSLMEEYSSRTIIFPSLSLTMTEEKKIQHLEHCFVKKIDEINHHEAKSEAISNFIYTRQIMLHELRNYEISPKDYNEYEDELHNKYKIEYRKALRNTNTNAMEENIINDSKNLYDTITAEDAPPFRNFNNTPRKFKNGLLHQLADDDSDENQRKIVWKLEGGR